MTEIGLCTHPKNTLCGRKYRVQRRLAILLQAALVAKKAALFTESKSESVLCEFQVIAIYTKFEKRWENGRGWKNGDGDYFRIFHNFVHTSGYARFAGDPLWSVYMAILILWQLMEQ